MMDSIRNIQQAKIHNLLTSFFFQIDRYYSQALRKKYMENWEISFTPVSCSNIVIVIKIIIALSCLLINWEFALLTVIMLEVIQIKILANQSQKIVNNYDFLKKFDWSAVNKTCKNGLQYVKFSRMIDKGYDMRCNTNIILQQEQTVQQQTDQQQEQQNQNRLKQKISDMRQLLQQIVLLCCQAQLLKINKIELLYQNNTRLYNFKSIFKTNYQFKYLFTHLWSISFHYQRLMLNTFIGFSAIVRKNQSLAKIIALLKTIKLKQEEIQNLLNELIQLHYAQEVIKIYDYFTKQNQLNEQIQKISEQLHLQIAQKQISKTASQINKVDDNSQETIKIKQRNLEQEQKTFITSLKQKKEFTQKLDLLLAIGLARRKQQLIQKESKINSTEEDISTIVQEKQLT